MTKISRLLAACFIAAVFLYAVPGRAETPPAPTGWRAKVNQALPLLGHRNWILIVDSAYPLQTSPGVETVETNAPEPEVLTWVLHAIGNSIHVRPIVYMDAELPFVTEQEAPGVTAWRKRVHQILGQRPVQSFLHEQLLNKIEETGKSYNILILKTNLTVPYTSVFLQLNCKYWSDDDEARLREAMKQAGAAQP